MPKPAYKQGRPREARDRSAMSKLADRICEAIQAAEAVKGDLKDRWDTNEAYVQGYKQGNGPSDGTELPLPILKPRLDQLKGRMMGVVFAQKPWFVASKRGQAGRVEGVEAALQFLLEAGRLKHHLGHAFDVARMAPPAVLRVNWIDMETGLEESNILGRYVGPSFDVIHPRDWICWPASAQGVSRARIHGHLFEMMLSDVHQAQRSGTWWPESVSKIVADSPRQNEVQGELQDQSAAIAHTDDQPVQLADVIWRGPLIEGQPERIVRVTIAVRQRQILDMEIVTIGMSPYVPIVFDWEYGKHYPESSTAQQVQGLMQTIATLNSEGIQSARNSSRPVVWEQGTSNAAGIKSSYEPGEIRQKRDNSRVDVLPVRFSHEIYSVVQQLTQFLDAGTSVSTTALGADSNIQARTATAERINREGALVASAEDVGEIGPSLIQVAKIVLKHLQQDHERVMAVYPHLAYDASVYDDVFLLDLATQSPQDMPQSVGQTLQAGIGVLQMAMQLFPSSPMIAVEMLRLLSDVLKTLDVGRLKDSAKRLAALADEMSAQLGIPPDQAPEMAPTSLEPTDSYGDYTDQQALSPGLSGIPIDALSALGTVDEGAEAV